MKKRILLVTEANEQVASGHLLESIELSNILRSKGFDVDLCINDDACDAFKERILGGYSVYHRSVDEDVHFFFELLKRASYGLIITDLRDVKDIWIREIKSCCDATICCIDEWGNRVLNCDVIINPMIDSYYWNYYDSKARLFAGNEYLILSGGILEYHDKQRVLAENVEKVCISMGGVDKFGTTLKLARWFVNNQPDINLNIVLGGGFPYKDELNELIGDNENVRVFQNIDYIYEVFDDADVAFCAGGNTLHELACMGVPVIVIPTMDHEYKNGKAFERRGFGITLNKAENLCDEDIDKGWKLINDFETRTAFSQNGKLISPGQGGELVSGIINEYMDI